MKRFWITSVAAMAAIFGLSACSTIKRLPSAGDFADTNVYIAGERADQIDPMKLRQKLSELEGIDLITDDGRSKLKQLLEKIDKNSERKKYSGRKIDVPDALKGIGGFHTRLLIRAALSPPDAVITQKLSGKIRRYIFNKYTYGGYLEVNTTVETFVNGTRTGKDKYWWSIAVLPGTYGVYKRDENNLTDPFPGTLRLPDAALDPENPRGIWKRHLDHKLYAVGEGIVVLAVTKNGDLLPKTDPAYESDENSCIDLLFKGYPPEQDLPPQSAYCLGRCQSPLIVNTGV